MSATPNDSPEKVLQLIEARAAVEERFDVADVKLPEKGVRVYCDVEGAGRALLALLAVTAEHERNPENARIGAGTLFGYDVDTRRHFIIQVDGVDPEAVVSE